MVLFLDMLKSVFGTRDSAIIAFQPAKPPTTASTCFALTQNAIVQHGPTSNQKELLAMAPTWDDVLEGSGNPLVRPTDRGIALSFHRKNEIPYVDAPNFAFQFDPEANKSEHSTLSDATRLVDDFDKARVSFEYVRDIKTYSNLKEFGLYVSTAKGQAIELYCVDFITSLTDTNGQQSTTLRSRIACRILMNGYLYISYSNFTSHWSEAIWDSTINNLRIDGEFAYAQTLPGSVRR